MLDQGAGVRSTQRLALGDVGGGVVAFTWPAELQARERYLYDGERGRRLLEAADHGAWEVDMRPSTSRPGRWTRFEPLTD
jgi:hypothetical protein